MKDLNYRYWMWISRGEMTGEAVMVYDAMMAVRAALESGARTRAEIVRYLASLGRQRPPFDGVGGNLAFGDDGAAERPFELAQVTSRGILRVGPDGQVIEPVDTTTAPAAPADTVR